MICSASALMMISLNDAQGRSDTMTCDEHRKEADIGIPRKMPIVELVKLLVRARYEKHFPPPKESHSFSRWSKMRPYR